MKKILFFVLSVITLVACDKDKGTGTDGLDGLDGATLPKSFTKHYISNFMNSEVLRVISDRVPGEIFRLLPDVLNNEIAALWISAWPVSSNGHYIFSNSYHYYEQIGDTCFNKMVYGGGLVTVAITVPLRNISITCDRDFNSDFPAGAELNSLFNVWFEDYYAVVRNGYKRPKGSYYYGKTDTWEDLTYFQNYPDFYEKLSEVNFPERPFIGNQWSCYLVVAPDQTGEYTFHVKVTLNDGKEMEATALPVLVKGKSD